jgi:hypothetical protein
MPAVVDRTVVEDVLIGAEVILCVVVASVVDGVGDVEDDDMGDVDSVIGQPVNSVVGLNQRTTKKVMKIGVYKSLHERMTFYIFE